MFGAASTLQAANLVLTGNDNPTLGQTFIIAQSTGTNALLGQIIGTFNGLPEGTVIPNFLGSGASAVVSYLPVNSLPLDNRGVSLTITKLATTTVISSLASSIYGQVVTLSATVSANQSTPTGNVEFFDDTTGVDLGPGVLKTTNAGSATWVYATSPTQLKFTGTADTIRAAFTPMSSSFFASSGTLPGGHYVLPALLTIAATTNSKTYDATPSAATNPTVLGLQGTDTVTGLAEIYGDPSIGSGKTLSVAGYTINDGNGGNNYAVTTVNNTTGEINPLTISSFVSRVVSGPNGFTASFNKPLNPADLTLYGTNLTTPQDVVLRGSKGGPIHGSLIFDPSNMSMTFVATASYLLELNSMHGIDSAVLPDDTYTITFLSGSGSNGFLFALEGGSGAGPNYTTAFTTSYQRNAAPVLSIPEFARAR